MDDQSPEDLAYGLESIRSLDFTHEVSQVSSFGKKNRISAKIEVVCDPLYIDEAANACFEQTSTIGLRTRLESRYVLHRMTEKLSLNGYDVRAKFVSRPSKISTVKLESRDLDDLKLNFAQRSQLRYEASMIRPDWGVMGGDQQDE